MKFRHACLAYLCLPVCGLFLNERPALAQVDHRGARPAERITKVIDDRSTVVRQGNRHPLARVEFDRGTVPSDTRLDRMILVLEPDQAQQKALDALLEAQQDPQSPDYHRWLTPEVFGERFGVAARDLDRVARWLESHGFEVEPSTPARREIIFSGTADQVRSAFHTEIHVYDVNGQRHFANAQDPEIPAALDHVVGGLVSLHDFHARPMHHSARPAEAPAPNLTSGGNHYMTPSDFAAIYDVAALYSQSLDGTGQSIAVAGRSNLNISDVQAFRSQFGLPPKNPAVVLNGPDPGIVSLDEQTEAVLDVEWAGAVARNASIQLVVSASTSASDGITLSSQYIVSHNLAPVVSLSFGSCEAAMGVSGNNFWKSLWQQAAAQGMTVLVSSGDSGAAGCDGASAPSATHAAGVNGLCSTPYSTCVGGTQFADLSNPTAYWSAGNQPGTFASALGYIPEAVWNASGSVAGGFQLWASGGGASQIYSKPAWQTGPGVPADAHRYVPDASLASAIHDGYIIQVNGQLYVAAGTSAATPSLAGLLSLVVQKTGAWQGNVNPALYALAQKQANGGAAVFHDVTSGNNSVPGLPGFNAGAGYDAATGLGSVDAAVLVNHWTDATVPTPGFQLIANPVSPALTQGTSGTVLVNVAISGGFNAPIVLSTGPLPAGLTAVLSPATLAAPGSGSASLKLTAAANMTAGSYNVAIAASGGGLSQNTSVALTILPNCTYSINPVSASAAAVAASYSFNVVAPAGCSWTATTGTSWIAVTGASGNGNGKVSYSVTQNRSLSSRSGAISLAGLTFGVTQAAGTAAFSLNSSSASFPSAGGTGSVTLSTNPANAAWTASSNASWITITNGASGTGSKTFTYSVASNSGASRTGTLTIAGLTFTVSQAGAVSACSYRISVSAVTQSTNGFAGTVSVLAAPGCQWTATSSQPWLAITSGATGSGNGAVAYLAAFNTTTTTRSATLTVAGYRITLTERPSTSTQ